MPVWAMNRRCLSRQFAVENPSVSRRSSFSSGEAGQGDSPWTLAVYEIAPKLRLPFDTIMHQTPPLHVHPLIPLVINSPSSLSLALGWELSPDEHNCFLFALNFQSAA